MTLLLLLASFTWAAPNTDDDGDGYAETDGDCDDTDDRTYPGARERLDGIDNDCNGCVDAAACGEDTAGADSGGTGDTGETDDTGDTAEKTSFLGCGDGAGAGLLLVATALGLGRRRAR